MESSDVDKDMIIQQLKQENEDLKNKLRKYTDNHKKYYDKNKATIRAQQNEYKRKMRQKETAKE